jgi:6-phospho-beta-glucosidase
MRMGLKVTVVGGASTYTPELMEGLLRRNDRLPVDEVALMDIAADRLGIVGGFARRMAEVAGWGGRVTLTTDRAEALEGADFVIVQLRVGGQAARQLDETLPPRYGAIGQETTGAGGLAKALRTVPIVLSIAEETARRAAPDAWLLDFTNPVGIVSQALLDAGHRAIGLCNVAITLQRQLARHLGVEAERVELEHVGLNHLSWVRAVRVDGVDRLPGLLDSDADELGRWVGLPGDLVRALGALPSSYLRYYYCTDEVLADQRAGGHVRASEVMAIESQLLEMYRDPTVREKPALLAERGGAWYSEAAAQLMASLHAGSGDIQVVDTLNHGALGELPDDVVVEVPARIDAHGAHPLPQAPLAPELRGLVEHAKAYEQLAVQAALSGDRGVALRALLANPLVGRYSLASALLDALLDANRAYLPRFFPEG